MKKYSKRQANGFTLIELLISLTILAAVLFFTIPFVSSLQQKNQLLARQDEIKAAIRFAKTQAQTTGNNLILAPLSDSNNWSNGMQLFVDNPKHRYTADATIVHEWRWDSSKVQISWHGFQSNHYLLFAANSSRNAINGYFSIQTQAQRPVQLVVNRLGRVKSQTMLNGP